MLVITLPDGVLLALPVVPGVEVGQPDVEQPIDPNTKATVTVRIILEIISTSTISGAGLAVVNDATRTARKTKALTTSGTTILLGLPSN